MKTHFITGVALILAAALTGHAQSPSPVVPQWQIDAGGKMAFDVASVKLNRSGSPLYGGDPSHSTIPLNNGDVYPPNGGYFSATNIPVLIYLDFAYKLTAFQGETLRHELAGWKWADSKLFDIQARALGNPTKDQMRLMMQDLLANRFKLKVHFETEQLPLFVVVPEKAGQTGPKLLRHPQGSSCDPVAPVDSKPAPKAADAFPGRCGVLVESVGSGRIRLGARDVPMALVASYLTLAPGVAVSGVPVIDRTGFEGRFDFTLDFTPDAPVTANFQPDASGPTFSEALKEQLGLKLEPTKGPVDVLVIDHIEEPTPN